MNIDIFAYAVIAVTLIWAVVQIVKHLAPSAFTHALHEAIRGVHDEVDAAHRRITAVEERLSSDTGAK